MLDALHQRIYSLASWPLTALLIVAFLGCSQGFDWRQNALGPSTPSPDTRPGYTPSDLRTLFDAWGPNRRHLYALTEVTLDVVFPIVYGTMFATCVARLFTGRLTRRLVSVPLIGMISDLSENGLLASLAWGFDGHESPLAYLASWSTWVKFLCFSASLLLLLVGGIAGLRRPMTSG